MHFLKVSTHNMSGKNFNFRISDVRLPTLKLSVFDVHFSVGIMSAPKIPIVLVPSWLKTRKLCEKQHLISKQLQE